jgi:hypothetical protein
MFQQFYDGGAEGYDSLFGRVPCYFSGPLSAPNLKAFLRTWVNRKPYRAALARGDRRVNLDGSDAGPAFGEIEQP